jgi:hypothetical protein
LSRDWFEPFFSSGVRDAPYDDPKERSSVRIAILGFIVFVGMCAILVSGHYLFLNWAALITYYGQFEEAGNSGADMRMLFILEAKQNAFRINCFAEGVGVLLGAILTAIGIHGMLTIDAAVPAKRIILGTFSREN